MEQTAEELPSLSGVSLLVLDDDPGIVRGLTRVLTGLGAETTGVGSLREARLLLETLSPDAVLADLQLKDGTALSLLPDYLVRNPDGAFYIITGHGSVGNAVAAIGTVDSQDAFAAHDQHFRPLHRWAHSTGKSWIAAAHGV